MGRMFRIISERGRATADDAPAVTDDIPFVEIGGPEGVVSSAPPVVEPTTPAVVQIPVTAANVVEAVTTEPPARVLSVAFHRLPKNGLRLVPAGVVTDLVTFHWPDHPVSHEYRAVRNEMTAQYDGTPRLMLFTAAVPETGATTVLLNLAVSLASETQAKVLVVDANTSRPAIARRLGLAESPGICEVLNQSTPLAWAIQPTPIANLHALTFGQGNHAGSLPSLLEQLRHWFDWVLIDAGVWSSDTPAAAVDGVYLVTRHTDADLPEFVGLRAIVASAGGIPRGYLTTRQ
jgi:Mrp family chromosome partitioning ATPase